MKKYKNPKEVGKIIRNIPVIVILTSLLLPGCTGRPEAGIDTINLQKTAAAASDYNLGELIDDIEFVPLETNDSCLISFIRRAEKHNNIYFIHTGWELHAFSEDGRYLNSFGKKGRGPGEFGTIRDFAIHKERDLVLLLTYNPNSVFVYRKSGEFLYSFPVEDVSAEEIEFGDEDEIVLMCENLGGTAENSYLWYNIEGELLAARPQYYGFVLTPVDGVYSAGPAGGFLIQSREQLFTKDGLSDTIYSISGRGLVPQYIFSTEGLGFTPEDRAVGKYLVQFLRTVWLLHHGNHLVVRIVSPDHGDILLFRNEKTGVDNAIRFAKKPKEDFYTALLNTMKPSSDGWFFTDMQAVALKNLILNNPDTDESLKQLATAIDENSNPVIVRFRLLPPG
ncbi:MAG: 6-bladed beta-propeller [Bacteroidales bacterium]|nr:6-bladed beta-propeller [Bacteroidales bacterium]